MTMLPLNCQRHYISILKEWGSLKPNNVNNQNKRHQSRWVITSATAIILTTLTIASQAAAADDTVTTTTN